MSGEQTDSTVSFKEDFFSKESYFARLEENDRKNLDELILLVSDLAEEKGFVLHLCPELAITNNPRETKTKAFFDFFAEAAKRKGWKYAFEDAFFDGFDHAGDGKFIIKPLSGKPIEILPLRKNSGASGIVILS